MMVLAYQFIYSYMPTIYAYQFVYSFCLRAPFINAVKVTHIYTILAKEYVARKYNETSKLVYYWF